MKGAYVMPNKEDAISILKGIEIFKHCTADELEQITGIISKKQVCKKEIIFYEGDPCSTVYFISRGQIKVFKTTEDGREQIVNILANKDMFPHVGLYGESYYPATAKSMEDGTLYFLYVDDFKRLLQDSPSISVKLLQILDGKIRDMQIRLSHVMGSDMTDKIINTLFVLAKASGTRTERGYEIKMEVTHQDIADMLGTTRETVSRVMSQLKRDGKIVYDSHYIRLVD
jgi:CRP/FNR family cyclic AMP-dependent transcriptional regulator